MISNYILRYFHYISEKGFLYLQKPICMFLYMPTFTNCFLYSNTPLFLFLWGFKLFVGFEKLLLSCFESIARISFEFNCVCVVFLSLVFEYRFLFFDAQILNLKGFDNSIPLLPNRHLIVL